MKVPQGWRQIEGKRQIKKGRVREREERERKGGCISDSYLHHYTQIDSALCID